MTTGAIQQKTGTLFNIQKYSVHDGPGIRTVVFLKGCPLNCLWCSNPESQSFAPELAFSRNKCITVKECRRCHGICANHAIIRGKDDKVNVDWQSCTNCLDCTRGCPAGALITYGQIRSVKDVIDEVEHDVAFYARSGGGLTLGGGEPLAQPDFALALLKEAKRRYIKTAIETCGFVSQKVLLEACGYCNDLMYDIKSLNPEKHKLYTGQDNKLILENFRTIREEYPKLPIRVRTPVIPGFNDTEEDIQSIVNFLKGLDVVYELLPYHRLGTQKYENTGRSYQLGSVSLDNNHFLLLKSIADIQPVI